MSIQEKTWFRIRITSAGLATVCLAFAVGEWWSFESDNRDRVQDAQVRTQHSIEASRSGIENQLQRIVKGVDTLATSVFTADSPSTEFVAEQLRTLLFSDPGYVEAGFAFAPFEFAHDVRLFGLSLQVTDDGVELLDLDAKQDYAREMPDWYMVPMSGEAHWSEPVYDEVSQRMQIRYASPVYRLGENGDRIPVGTAYAVLNATIFSRPLSRMDLGENGYAYLLSSSGRYFVHPNRDFIGHDFFSDDESSNGSTASWTGTTINGDGQGTTRIIDADTNMAATKTSLPIKTAGWTLGIVLFEQDYQLDADSTRRITIRIRLLLGAAVFLAAIALIGVDNRRQVRFWTLSWLFSLICIGLYWLIVQASFATHALHPNGQLIVTQLNTLETFKSDHARRGLAERGRLPLFIPTGIYMHSLNFVGPTDLRVTGLIWQRYTDKVHDDIERGFVMPESAAFEVEKSYSQRIGNDEVVGWNFKATLSEALEYSGYPFGRETVSIQLWHKQFYQDVVLIPDLESYKDVRPLTKPGLVNGLSVLGWNVEGTFFSFANQSYATSFGLRDYVNLSDFPELFFSVQLRKQVISPFVANILPLSVVLILLFALLVLGASRQRQQKSGIALNAVAAGAGLFLLVIFSHINLRANLAAREVFYLEYYYFLVYLVIIGVTVNYLLFTKTDYKLVHYKGNLIAKILYWPLTQFTILAFTLAEFY